MSLLMRERSSDTGNDIVSSLMLPEPQHTPPQVLQGGRVPKISPSIRIELISPPLGVVSGFGCMLRTPVPEAAIDEHNDLPAGEDDVASASK